MVNVIGKLILLSLLKKVSVFVVAKTYGFPRLYRRLMECNRKFIKNPDTRKVVRNNVQYFFRLPRKIVELFNRRKEQHSTGMVSDTFESG
eukprot:jgi/Galph1/5624/GphlegSOOS_G4300.1